MLCAARAACEQLASSLAHPLQNFTTVFYASEHERSAERENQLEKLEAAKAA